jgi:hypothetical protein
MRGLHCTLAALALGLALPAASHAQVGEPGYEYDYDYDDYAPAVAEFYGSPVDRMPRWIRADELPLVYLLAREADVSPHVVIALRERGWSWIDITYHLGVDPYLYVHRMPHTTGYWRRYSPWEYRYLTDRHIIDYVNLFFWADYHRRPIHQVIIIRQQVPTWRYYARYHAPPRYVARGVYVRRTPSRPSSPRGDSPRYAVPRDDSERRGAVRDDRRSDDRRAQPPRSSPGTRPAEGIRRDAPNDDDRSRRTEGRTAQPRDESRYRTDERERSRPSSPSSVRDAGPSRREATPSRTEAPSDRGAAVRRDEGTSARSTAPPPRGSDSRGTAAPSSRGSDSRSSAEPSSRGSDSRGTAAPASRGSDSRSSAAPSSRGSERGTASARSSSSSGRRGN